MVSSLNAENGETRASFNMDYLLELEYFSSLLNYDASCTADNLFCLCHLMGIVLFEPRR